VTDSDRLALRALVDEYAGSVDRRDFDRVGELFIETATLAAYLNSPDAAPQYERRGRDEIVAAISKIARYDSTTHVVGQQRLTIGASEASSETPCVAHHLYDADGVARDRVLSLRYLDDFVCTAAGWRFARRRLVIERDEDHAAGSSI
jgi:SnoaL-like domain